MTSHQLYQKIQTNFRQDEPVYIRALQSHSGKNLDISMLSHKKIEKGYEPLLYHIGFSKHEDSIKTERLVQGGFWNEQRQKSSVLLTRIAIGSEPGPEVQALSSNHDRLFVIDLDAAQNSLEFFYQKANGSVSCHDAVPSELLTKIINLKDGSEKFGKEKYKEEDSSPTKKGRCDYGQPGETSWHNVKQETFEPGGMGRRAACARSSRIRQRPMIQVGCKKNRQGFGCAGSGIMNVLRPQTRTSVALTRSLISSLTSWKSRWKRWRRLGAWRTWQGSSQSHEDTCRTLMTSFDEAEADRNQGFAE